MVIASEGLVGMRGPAQQRMQPGDELAEVERLDQVVVGAGLPTRR